MKMSKSNIQEFYKDQTLLVTGGTGLIGKLLVRKLLVSCGVKKIYLLIRNKKKKTPYDRLELLLESYSFQSIKLEKQEFIEKIGVIKGDCTLNDLGISQEDRQMLINNVTSIIHISATVKFDEHLRIAANTNVKSVIELLKLAKDVKNLKAMVYVSSAYSNCNQKYKINEQFYDPPMRADDLFSVLETMEDKTLDRKISKILGEWPNTYTFTKAIAENVIRDEGHGLPIAITRPGIVMGPCTEPEPGCLDTVQGITAYSVATYVGLIHCVCNSWANTAAIVPLDYVINNILSVGWAINQSQSARVPIYNFTGSPKNHITWGMYTELGGHFAKTYPSMSSIWFYSVFVTKNKYIFTFCHFWVHLIPAYLVDLVLYCLGKEPKFVKICDKIHKTLKPLHFFSLNTWKFENKNTECLWEIMNQSDKEVFPFNMDELQWGSYIMDCGKFLRLHVLKDPLDTLSQAKQRQTLLKTLHYLLMLVLISLLFCLFRFLLNCVY